MRYSLRACLFLAVALALVPAVHAQPRVRATIETVLIGFPANPESLDSYDSSLGRGTLFKSGFWTPVYVTIKAGPDGNRGGRVIVEATDSDDVQNTYTVPFPALEPNDYFVAQAFTKTGSANGDIGLKLEEQVAEDRYKTIVDNAKKSFSAIGQGDPFCLVVGSRMPGLQQQVAGLFVTQNNQERLRLAYVDNVGLMPNRWFGYAPVDLLILTTGKREFVNSLLGEANNRKEALAEWVRRGGHLVVSCGRNQDAVPDLFRRAQLPLPVNLAEQHVATVDALRNWLPVGTPPLQAAPLRNGAAATIVTAKLETRPGMYVEPIVPDRENDVAPPVIVRWPYGLGQITLVAFDLDEAPFTAWPGQKEFWKKLFTKMGMRPTEPQPNTGPNAYNEYGRGNDLASLLQNNLESFRDVSVISFGWVALFILIYIIIVGPLDYLFLKKVVKRLELTWITFPTVVVVVSAGAYFAAYSLKGNDLRVNKVDLVDIDLENQQAYGTSWFTIFSPRIQLYTIGVEPAAPLFGPEDAAASAKPAPVVVTWMGKPDESYGGYGRARSQSLFHRTYKYEPDATGLREVPIQVWSSKSFTANWEARWPANQRQGLRHRESPRKLEGSVTNPLPIRLEDVAVLYGEGSAGVKVYRLDTLEPGESRPIIDGKTKSQNMSQWLENLPVANLNYQPYRNQAPQTSPSDPLMKRVMFYEAGAGPGQARDTALRYLDQNWRLNEKNVAILCGRVARQDGPAEAITQNAATPTRLWLGQLPGRGDKRPQLDGMLVQDTYVRVFIPVPPAPDEGGQK